MAQYGTLVCSRCDRKQFLTDLDEIEGRATPEHMKLLGRVYGDVDRWLRPSLVDVLARPRARRSSS